MIYGTTYNSPIGKIFIASRNEKIIGTWIEGQKYFLSKLEEKIYEKEEEKILLKAKEWLNEYFAGKKPEIKKLDLAPEGSEFAKSIWNILCQIPYGNVTTYGVIAQKIVKIMGKNNMSAQAVGGAVGHNPISIIIPCHRVIGKDGSLTGYAGGVDKKKWLLKHEGIDNFSIM